MINLKETLANTDLTAYRLSKELDISETQIWTWTSGLKKPRKLSERILVEYFNKKKIKVYYVEPQEEKEDERFQC